MKKFLLLLIIMTGSVIAEETPSGNGFFDKDFVTGKKPDSKTETSGTDFPSPDPSAPGISDKTIQNEFGEKVFALGILVDIYDKKHFNKVLENYNKIISESKLYPAPIYLYGIHDAVYKNPLFINLILAGAEFTSVFTLPKPHGIKYSPTWIISLERGQVLVEGLMDLDKYIQKGMYYEKMIPDYHKKKEIEEKPQAF